jgi:hypothetical protein
MIASVGGGTGTPSSKATPRAIPTTLDASGARTFQESGAFLLLLALVERPTAVLVLGLCALFQAGGLEHATGSLESIEVRSLPVSLVLIVFLPEFVSRAMKERSIVVVGVSACETELAEARCGWLVGVCAAA